MSLPLYVSGSLLVMFFMSNVFLSQNLQSVRWKYIAHQHSSSLSHQFKTACITDTYDIKLLNVKKMMLEVTAVGSHATGNNNINAIVITQCIKTSILRFTAVIKMLPNS